METPEQRTTTKSRHLHRNVSERIQKSFQILESAVPSSNVSMRMGKTPGSSRSYTSHYVEQHPFDVTSFLDASNSHAFLSGYEVNQPAHEVRGLTNMPDVSATTNIGLMEETDPGENVTAGIYGQFSEAKSAPAGDMTTGFDLLDKYMDTCQENITKLNAVISKLPIQEGKFIRAVQLKNLLQHELNTWELTKVLFQDRCMSLAGQDTVMRNANSKSLKEFINSLYEQDSSLRENQIVVDWLEQVAFRELKEGHHLKYEYFAKKCIAWEGTLNLLQQNSPHGSRIEHRPVVDELDPDSPFRQGKPLMDLDREDEVQFLKSLFLYIRSGQLPEAQRLCENCGQYWRAATLEGWRLFHDPNYSEEGSRVMVKGIEGNAFRQIWKVACWNMTLNESVPHHERAIYAALCGNLKVLLSACCSWEEYLWAYFRIMIDNKVETQLYDRAYVLPGLVELPPEYWEQTFTPEFIFKELSASTSDVVQKEGNEPFHIIQKFLILNDVKGLIEAMHELLTKQWRHASHLIRFMAHLILFLIRIGEHGEEESSSGVLEKYVEVLIEKKLAALIPSYIAALPKSKQVYWCALFMEDITNLPDQKSYLQHVEAAGLDVPLITKTVVENMRIKEQASRENLDNKTLQLPVLPEDEQKINSLNWLMFDPTQRTEALSQANALMRLFLLQNKLEAARTLFAKILPDSISLILKYHKDVLGTTELSGTAALATREYLCYQVYFEAQNAVSDWFEHFHHGKPQRPDLPSSASFGERVAFEHREKQYEADCDRWDHTLKQQTETTTGKLYNILLFVDGGWLTDQEDGDRAKDENRLLQLQRLRERYLPEFTMMLYSILHATGQDRECLQLADIVVSEKHRLYKAFKKQDLHMLLDSLWKSSVSLLDQNLDPLGYPLK